MRACTSLLISVALVLSSTACAREESRSSPDAATLAPPSSTDATPAMSASEPVPATGPTTTSGSSPWAPPSTTAPAPPVPLVAPIATPGASGIAATGAELYALKCSSCHGADARGDTVLGKKYGMLDFRSPQVRALTTGGLGRIMSVGRGKISEDAHPKADLTEIDLRNMVAFIQSLE